MENSSEHTAQEWNIIFESIYKDFYSPLCAFASSMMHDDDEAEEIVQRTMTKLWEQRDKLNEIENLKSYLFRAVKNNCFNEIAHSKIEVQYQTNAWLELKEMEMNSIVEDGSKDERIDILSQTIKKLPDKCKDTLMNKLEGLKNKEIAEKLNISVKAVEANITRAFSMLRENMKDSGFK